MSRTQETRYCDQAQDQQYLSWVWTEREGDVSLTASAGDKVRNEMTEREIPVCSVSDADIGRQNKVSDADKVLGPVQHQAESRRVHFDLWFRSMDVGMLQERGNNLTDGKCKRDGQCHPIDWQRCIVERDAVMVRSRGTGTDPVSLQFIQLQLGLMQPRFLPRIRPCCRGTSNTRRLAHPSSRQGQASVPDLSPKLRHCWEPLV